MRLRTKRFFSLVFCFLILTASMPCTAFAAREDTVRSNIEQILAFKMKESGAADVQSMIDGALAAQAGTTAEWYILAIRQYRDGYDYTKYAAALQKYVDADTAGNAVKRAHYALLFIATGTPSRCISEALNGTIGKMGIMSWVYGLHLLNNDYTSKTHTVRSVTDQLLSMQLADGGWSVSGSASDVDVTAMVVQSLAPQYAVRSDVRTAVDRALEMLSARQDAQGEFSSYGITNPESTAQVIAALCALGMDPFSDARFIKGGNTLLDVLLQYKCADGSFCHEKGKEYSHAATFQALYALVAAYRQMHAHGSLYLFPASERPNIPLPQSTVPATVPPAPARETDRETTTRPQTTQNTTTTQKHTSVIVQKDVSAASTTAKTTVGQTTAPQSATPTQTEISTEAAALPQTTASAQTYLPSETESEHGRPTDPAQMYVFVTQAPSETFSETQTLPQASTPGNSRAMAAVRWLIIGIWSAAVIACVVLWLLGKRNKKFFFVILLIAAAVTGIGLFASHWREKEAQKMHGDDDPGTAITVTIGIRCDAILGQTDDPSVPADGVVLCDTAYTAPAGTSAYKILLDVAARRQIPVQSSTQFGNVATAYVSAIAGIREFDYGGSSGWLYTVNGEVPSVGCGKYRVQDGDVIEWIYTCDGGESLR